MADGQDLLQHPRRNLGNRYRTTALKFSKLATDDPTRANENMAWAEQNARQAILHFRTRLAEDFFLPFLPLKSLSFAAVRLPGEVLFFLQGNP